MGIPLTAVERAQLEAKLKQRQDQLDRRLAEHRGGKTRAEHAQELLEQESDNAPEREIELGLDLAIIEREERDLAAVRQALARLRDGGYGICAECDAPIPLARLQVEPWALRCVPCEGAREAAAR